VVVCFYGDWPTANAMSVYDPLRAVALTITVPLAGLAMSPVTVRVVPEALAENPDGEVATE